jgi:hypothetical protein
MRALALILALIGFAAVARAQQGQTYFVYSTAAYTDASGNQFAACTVINAIVWDGVTPYNPGAGLRLIAAAQAGNGATITGCTPQ